MHTSSRRHARSVSLGDVFKPDLCSWDREDADREPPRGERSAFGELRVSDSVLSVVRGTQLSCSSIHNFSFKNHRYSTSSAQGRRERSSLCARTASGQYIL